MVRLQWRLRHWRLVLATQDREERQRHPQQGFRTLGFQLGLQLGFLLGLLLGLLLGPPREPQEQRGFRTQELMQGLLLEPLLGPLLGPPLERQERQQVLQELQKQRAQQELAKQGLLLEGFSQPPRKLVREW